MNKGKLVVYTKNNMVGRLLFRNDKNSLVYFEENDSTMMLKNKYIVDYETMLKKDSMLRKWEVVDDKFRCHPNIEIKLPQKATKNSIAYDFYSPCDVVLEPMKPTLIMTDVKAKFFTGEGLIVNVRSSMGKVPIIMANSQGWIESDYYSNPTNDGNIGFMLLNLSDKSYEIKMGDRIGQGMIIPVIPMDNGNSDNKRIGGFGSSGK